MEFFYVKALHIVFVVSWFAGLFYIVRLFIYHVEAEQKEEPARAILQDQYKIMSKRLWYIITWPAAILATVFGLWLVSLKSLWTEPWMLLKFSLIFGLWIYQLICHKIFLQQQKAVVKMSSTKLRLWNEVATLFLFAIVFVVTLKSLDNWYWGVVGIVLFGVLMTLIVKWYKNWRAKRGED